ncbi:MFS transporter [Alginatibacterium sediminis]|uniref:MFS transporter n=1 Tax=Alginatibacterium sediminis TaxID=2164068 RepID=A0A420E618_9ALTE|nr:organoarsenical effux MFS transporter ArsJ [Alginatibacterium sediminis]RKF12785.1 MFS transporter [Alginatibacterium sediminis]
MSKLPEQLKQYFIITGNYWAFTLTDGALRMLVVLHFHRLGYSPFEVAMLFLFYEVFGVITNLVGGWLGARIGLNKTMNIGLGLQILALLMLIPNNLLSLAWVMLAQAISGVAKDLNKMSAKSSIKALVSDSQQTKLYSMVAALTGSKNALKGCGFFLGGALLSLYGFQTAIAIMAVALALVWIFSLLCLKQDLGRAKNKPKFSQIFSKSGPVNTLSAARMFLFGARDVWFVVALPVYLASVFAWDHWNVGGFIACWVIAYGFVQSVAPYFTGKRQGRVPDGKSAFIWASTLALIPASIALGLHFSSNQESVVVIGLLIFGVVFAINSSLHSYLIVSYADADGVSLDVGFYYMANAMGRLIGTVLSGWVYQVYGFEACLWISSLFVAVAAAISIKLPLRKPAARHN